jgi:hypothetical protein
MKRRNFLKAAASVSVAFHIVPRHVLGGAGQTPPSEKIVLAHIGMGWFGKVDLKIFLGSSQTQNVAVCDVDAAKRDEAKALVDSHYGNTDCKTYRDFREMLQRDDIDAVSIATPDHWHAIPTVWAARHGKDVHIEKQLSLTIQQGRAIVDAVRRCGRVCQVGSESRSNSRCRFGCELVRNGRIGKVVEVFVGPSLGLPSSATILPAEPVPTASSPVAQSALIRRPRTCAPGRPATVQPRSESTRRLRRKDWQRIARARSGPVSAPRHQISSSRRWRCFRESPPSPSWWPALGPAADQDNRSRPPLERGTAR